MQMTRRHALTAGAAALAVASRLPAHAAQPASGKQAPGFYRYRVGDIEVTAISDGFASRPLDGFIPNAELAAVRQALDDAFLPNDRATIPFTTLVLNTGGRLVMIDSGNGDLAAPTSGVWMQNFRAAGFTPEAVDQVVISHFHGDHINGLRLKDGTTVFPRAEISVPAAEWDFWMNDANMAQASDGLKPGFANVRRVFGPMAKDVTRYDAGKSPAPNVAAVAAPGHTPGHTTFNIQSGTAGFMAMSDTTNHPALFVRNPDWSAVFDMDGAQARATRRRLLDMVTAERTPVGFYHAPFPATGHIARDGTGFRLVPVNWTPAI
jgi:glyoxylase-like metal-dependent hydrolase (beta-lactamase superfamily II)